jgi:hypothetical protein
VLLRQRSYRTAVMSFCTLTRTSDIAIIEISSFCEIPNYQYKDIGIPRNIKIFIITKAKFRESSQFRGYWQRSFEISRNSDIVILESKKNLTIVDTLRQTQHEPQSNILLWFGNLHGVVGTDSLTHRSVYWKAWEHDISSFLYMLDNVHISSL